MIYERLFKVVKNNIVLLELYYLGVIENSFLLKCYVRERKILRKIVFNDLFL